MDPSKNYIEVEVWIGRKYENVGKDIHRFDSHVYFRSEEEFNILNMKEKWYLGGKPGKFWCVMPVKVKATVEESDYNRFLQKGYEYDPDVHVSLDEIERNLQSY